MAKKGNGDNGALKPETKARIVAVVFFALAFFAILASGGTAGRAGRVFFENLKLLFGLGYFFIPLLFVLLGMSFSRGKEIKLAGLHLLAGVLFLISGLGLIEILGEGGGVVGGVIAKPFVFLFDIYVSIIFLIAIFAISCLLIFEERIKLGGIFAALKKIPIWLGGIFRRLFEKEKEQIVTITPTALEKSEKEKPATPGVLGTPGVKPKKKSRKEETEEEFVTPGVFGTPGVGSYTFPPINLLESDRGEPGVGDIRANLNIIKRTFENFGIQVEMDEVTIGPSVTRYALKPAEGVKLSRIVALQNDLALALAAHPLRIEAPIPGKSLVGIEIPNKKKSIVGLAPLLSDSGFKDSPRPLTFPLGRGLSGKAVFASLAKMPHLLIGGTTGSGKSVSVHTLVTSFLYRHGPETLRLILVDPKRVELTLYNKIPHLLTPVITDPKKAILALRWAAKEMENRYNILEKESVRDINSYHQRTKDKKETPPMPYIVIIIDELADIMSSYPRELEAAIVRLAQMSRAVGIHLVLSTQRPSVNVITGLIKANIPSRVALQVSSQIDSRTIIDQAGAEKLLGSGDMLYLGNEMKQPERIQGAFISEDEVKKVVKFLSEHNELAEEALSFSTPGVLGTPGVVPRTPGVEGGGFAMSLEEESLEGEDSLYEEAKRLVLEAKKASTSYLQRRLKVGYSRAARLIDLLEEKGVVSPGEGAKPREVYENDDNQVGSP